MDYENYVKQKYLKLAVKGVKIPFAEKWESALVAAQCIFSINSNMQMQAAKLVEGIPDKFNDDFSNGTPIKLNTEGIKYLSIYLRSQNFMRQAGHYISTSMPKLDAIILKEKEKIDEGIYKYYIGTKGVLTGYAEETEKQVAAIDNSLIACFPRNQEDLFKIRNELNETFTKTKIDLENLNAKFAEALTLNNILIPIG